MMESRLLRKDMVKPRVLVVEDDPALGRLVELVLRINVDVTLVKSGAEACDILDEQRFDALTVDISLPDMSGLEVIARGRETSPSAGIVAITGMVDVEVAVGAMKAGADDFVGKPFKPELLWHVINKATENRRRQIEAEQAETYRKLAYTDALTGSLNRRFLDEFVIEAVAISGRTGQPLAVAYMDIDNFKLLNDVVGYEKGDIVLKKVAHLLRVSVREPAMFGRFGGDEFVAIFPGQTAAQARTDLARVTRGLAEVDIVNSSGMSLPVRLSVGLAEFHGFETPRELIAEAEDQMYLDKSVLHTLLASGTDVPDHDPVLKVANLKALRNLVTAIDRRDSYTRFHSDHATRLALDLAAELEVDADVMRGITIGGPIHDLGKIVIPDSILRKPGPLTLDERHTMEEHPLVGAAITAAVTDYETVVDLVRHHHERFDGTGYPGRIGGNTIRLATRIFTLADTFSAITTDRPYRRGLTTEQAIDEIMKNRGSQFDPDLATAFCRTIEKDTPKADAA